jgi:hypothetical protein
MINFIPKTRQERIIYNSIDKSALDEYFNDTKKKYYNGQFYLGGQIKMGPDDEITLKKFDEIREITRKKLIEYGGPCNSWEAASIANSERILNNAEKIVKCYLKIGYLRELEKVNKLNTDINTEIVKFL